MVVETAHSGRGSYSMVADNSNLLNGLVVKALANAFEPSLKGCTMLWNGQVEKLDEVFRNQSVMRTARISKQEFETFMFKFASKEDPITKQPINLECTANEFRKVGEGAASKALFKMAAHDLILKGKDVIPNSLKYQVLCEETAMIGIVKQKEKTTGEVKEYE